MRARALLLLTLTLALAVGAFAQSYDHANDYLHWLSQQAESVGKSTYRDGKVGTRWFGDTRGLKTERAQNYKVRATWFTPEVIRASARFVQLKDRLSDRETQAMVAEAETVRDTVIMIELDPNEGSGVIPLDWSAFLQPKGNASPNDAVRGVQMPDLRKSRVFQGVMQRNYDYERFWVAFPLVREDGQPLAGPGVHELELVVRIYNKEGSVIWEIPPSFH